jgi:hypothetical protein
MIENAIKLVVGLERPDVVGHPGVFFEPAKVMSSLKVFETTIAGPTTATTATAATEERKSHRLLRRILFIIRLKKDRKCDN